MSAVFFKANWAEMEKETKHLIDAYRKLPPYIAKKHLRASMRRSIKPFVPALKAATPKRSGNLRRSVKAMAKFYKRAEHGSVAGVVGFSRGSKTVRNMGNHSAIVNDGTELRRKASGASTGRMPARRMLQQTLASHGKAILANVVSELAVGLERAAKELAAKNKGG